MRILIVDDNERNIFALSAVLTAKGYSCVSASSAAAGLKLLDEIDDIAIMLVDMMMPEMDGYEMIAHIKNGAKASVPILAVTAQAMNGDRERCLKAGADGYIAKPIDVATLIELLNAHHIKPHNAAD
jgi:two-component system cell cycle response regulator DivK